MPTRFGLLDDVLLLHHLIEPLDLLLVLAHHGIFRILVDVRLVLYVFRPICVAQRAQRLVVIVVRWRDARDHERFRVAAERVLGAPEQTNARNTLTRVITNKKVVGNYLQQPSELRVPVWNVSRLAVDKS